MSCQKLRLWQILVREPLGGGIGCRVRTLKQAVTSVNPWMLASFERAVPLADASWDNPTACMRATASPMRCRAYADIGSLTDGQTGRQTDG